MQIVFAVEENWRAVFELLREMHRENGLYKLSYEKTGNAIVHTLKTGAVLLAMDDRRLAGTMGLIEGAAWYSDQPFITDRWTYVHPDYRKEGVFEDLIAAARKVAAEAKLPLQLGITTPMGLKAKQRLYRSQGFKAIGILLEDTKAGSSCASTTATHG